MQQCLICYLVIECAIIDGNAICASQQRFAIAASEHRLKELRQISSAPLPGQYEGCV